MEAANALVNIAGRLLGIAFLLSAGFAKQNGKDWQFLAFLSLVNFIISTP